MNRGLINACKSDLGSDKHYLGSSGNKAREKFRAKQEFNLRFRVRPCYSPKLVYSSNVFFRFAVFQQIFQFTNLPCSKCTVKLTEKLDTQRL